MNPAARQRAISQPAAAPPQSRFGWKGSDQHEEQHSHLGHHRRRTSTCAPARPVPQENSAGTGLWCHARVAHAARSATARTLAGYQRRPPNAVRTSCSFRSAATFVASRYHGPHQSAPLRAGFQPRWLLAASRATMSASGASYSTAANGRKGAGETGALPEILGSGEAVAGDWMEDRAPLCSSTSAVAPRPAGELRPTPIRFPCPSHWSHYAS